jgi:hypothetical protein
MSRNCSFSECVYLDTNVLSLALEHSEWYRPFFNFLFRNHRYIAFSDSLLLELSQVERKHADLDTFFTILPWGEIKSFETVIEEEVKSYPKKRTEPLLVNPQNLELGEQTISQLLTSVENEEARRKQVLYAKRMKQQFDLVKSNFPPSTVGWYTREQARTFAWMITMQWLTASHPAFMKKLNDKGIVLKAEAFPSIQLYAYYVYYKYFLGNRKPKELSEFGDLFHLFYFPYCKLLILERDMCEILNEIKSSCKVLSGVEVRNMDFFGDHEFVKR